MHYRSWLFVPGDSEQKLGKAVSAGADVIIVDLAGAVAPEMKPVARRMAREWLDIHRKQITGTRLGRWVRINALDTPLWRDDLIAVMQAAPDGIVLPKAGGPQSVQQLAAEIYELEQINQIPSGSTRIMPLASETAQAAMTVGSYIDASLPRLFGLTWGAQDLSAALGATRKYDGKGLWTDAFRFVRAQVLLTAHARGILAIDTPHADYVDEKGLKAAARDARADGFSGMLALHPAQVPIINETFIPTEEELAEARAILAAFETNPGAGTLLIDQRMIDQPRLKLARRTLGLEEGQTADSLPRGPILRSA